MSLEGIEEGDELIWSIWSHHKVDLGCSSDQERDLEEKQHLVEK